MSYVVKLDFERDTTKWDSDLMEGGAVLLAHVVVRADTREMAGSIIEQVAFAIRCSEEE